MSDGILSDNILKVRNLTVEYRTRSGSLRALDAIDADVRRGEILGIAGESGCGKSTLSGALLRLIGKPHRTSGGIEFAERGDIMRLSRKELRSYRWAEVSAVFQASQNSLNPLLRIAEQARLVMQSHRPVPERDVKSRVEELLKLVNLEPARVMNAYPHELSGGMKQRVGIMMSLLLNPRVVILDEPTTALDVISQALVLDILKNVHERLATTLIFITHDISVIADLAQRVMVMYAGRIVEIGPVESVFFRPAHPYTAALLKSATSLDGDPLAARSIPGQPPDLRRPPPGCRFAPRCPLAVARCRTEDPALAEVAAGHHAACLLAQPAKKEEARL